MSGDTVAAFLKPLGGRFWRMHAPMWAFAPMSGDGAARFGGRWNPQGLAALYLSETHGTAIAEAQQGVAQPGTIVPYDVAATRIADLTDPAVQAELALTPAILNCPWRSLWLIDRIRPPTWPIVDRLIAAGTEGALVASTVGPDRNLVLWSWNAAAGADPSPTVTTIDPHGALPADQSSWRP